MAWSVRADRGIFPAAPVFGADATATVRPACLRHTAIRHPHALGDRCPRLLIWVSSCCRRSMRSPLLPLACNVTSLCAARPCAAIAQPLRVVGVTGVSRSGKGTLAASLAAHVAEHHGLATISASSSATHRTRYCYY
jgi:hypothetical protein